MKRTIRKTTDMEVDVPPFFTYGNCFAYKVVEDNNIICVDFTSTPAIQNYSGLNSIPSAIEWVPITEERFNELFNQTMNTIIEKSGVHELKTEVFNPGRKNGKD